MTDQPNSDSNAEPQADRRNRIAHIELDAKSLARANPDVEHERKVAIFDLLEENVFEPASAPDGPYELYLSIIENRLAFDIRLVGGADVTKVLLSLTPLRKTIKDYFLVCENYYEAIRNAAPAQIETIDMARRGLHNEGSDILQQRLEGKIKMDFDTCRRLFTLICILHLKG